LTALAVGCYLPPSPTYEAVPPEWRRCKPFSPEANAARARGELSCDCSDPRAPLWNAFAHHCIRDGDILFRRGRSYTVSGKLTSLLLTTMCGGKYSHDGIAHWEGDRLWVYDVERDGARNVPFDFWMLDVLGDRFAVKRVKTEYRRCIPQALAFCADAYHRHVAFDFALSPDDERFYCTEMVEKSYLSAGLNLSEPVPIRRLPGYKYWRFLRPPARLVYGVRVDSLLFSLGNDHYGTFGSKHLETVFLGDPLACAH
jgi:hypothetical protein